MKIVKGNKVYPFITGEDVIITKGPKSMKSVDDALDEQQKEIDKLKSNVKYLYSYGGVGGNGGGNGGGSVSTAKPSLVVNLANRILSNDGNPIVLGNTGTYSLNCNVRDNVNAETFYLQIGYGNNVDGVADSRPITLSPPCKYSTNLQLNNNGKITVIWKDMNDDVIDIISQNYIVNPHTFAANLKYISNTGATVPFPSDSCEYFMGSSDVKDPFIDISYRIDLPDVSGIEIDYSVSNTDIADGVNIKRNTSSGSLQINLEDIKKDGESLLQNKNMGSYNVNVKLTYSTGGNAVNDEISFVFVLIPHDMYIDVRCPQNIMYNTFVELINSKTNGVNGIPELFINQGMYASFYTKVYEGEIRSQSEQYTVTCNVYDYIDGDYEYDESHFSLVSSLPEESMTVVEQVESSRPFSIPFSTTGIKKIVFKTNPSPNKGIGVVNDTIKYVYVKKKDSTIDSWSPVKAITEYYFRANNDKDTYSANFPVNSKFGTLPWEFNVTDKGTYTISDEHWRSMDNAYDTTILSIGIQYSKINSEVAEILRTYTSATAQNPDLILYSNRLFKLDEDTEICIPYAEKFNKSTQNQYHLLQIVRTNIGTANNKEYATYLYIDGVPESVKTSIDNGKLFIGKIVFNNVNVAYNLINIQYLTKETDTIDILVYHYWLKYKTQMLGLDITNSEKLVFNNMRSIKFDGSNVLVDDVNTIEKNLAPYMPIPTMMVSYTVPTDKTIDEFESGLFRGYPNGDTSFGRRLVDVFWADNKHGWKQIDVPSLNGLVARWYVELQGTSTMRNRIKNFSLGLETNVNESNENILISPNFEKDNYSTFLPEQIWTLKADVADSAHANNTSIGKFVNSVCTKFNTGESHPEYIKNTLEGFPFLMFFNIKKAEVKREKEDGTYDIVSDAVEKTYYFGVYNFNMGRNSYYNLGYYTAEKTNEMISNIHADTSKYGPFVFSYGTAGVSTNLSIAEVQDNQPQFGFHQYHDSVLFQSNNSSITKMFGTDNKITYGNTLAEAKGKLSSFVKSVAEAGAYCFANIGKNEVPSIATPKTGAIEWNNENKSQANGLGCEDRYNVPNQVPDMLWQMKYNTNDEITWDNSGKKYSDIVNDPDVLFRCICNTLSEEGTSNTPKLNYTSASEYYVICMTFAMVDSVCKNMNIKSWHKDTNYIAFYDMDCGLGEDNSGAETVSYLAAMDYWHSDIVNDAVGDVRIDWDYWDDTIGKGFDVKSSYLFAIVKYAQSLLGDKYGVNLYRYPQQFWAELRKKNGELRNADYFVDKYFKSGIGSIPPYLAALNYQVKYLYRGVVLDDRGMATTETPLALVSGFHGSRVFKVKDWLSKRLRILDMMFNVQGIKKEIYSAGGVYMPSVDKNILNELRENGDISILQSAFSTFNNNNALITAPYYINVKAPMNTPVVILDGSSAHMYLLNKGINNKDDKDNYNALYLRPTMSQTYQCLGSKDFIDISLVNPLLTDYYKIESDNLENIICDNGIPPINHQFEINSTSVKNITMPVNKLKGNLIINNSGLMGQSVNILNVSNSGFYGEWSNLDNLMYLNISSVKSESNEIDIYGCKKLKGENCIISGKDNEDRTILNRLAISDVSGVFTLSNTSIATIEMVSLKGEESTFEIDGDKSLTTLRLTGFSSIKISNCPNLTNLYIIEDDENYCKLIDMNLGGEYTSYIEKEGAEKFTPKLTKLNTEINGVFDFTQYEHLETLGVSGCYGVEVIKIPNRKVGVTTFQNNLDLEFVDTFGENSCIELTKDNTFYMCPRYGMKQSWISDEGNSVRTKMCISNECTSLQGTFNRVYSNLVSKYLKPNRGVGEKYKNAWDEEIYNTKIGIEDAQYFIEDVVQSKGLDDIYIDSGGNIVDSQSNNKIYGDGDCSANITSLASCFKYQDGIIYLSPGSSAPSLSKYENLVNVAEMYNETGVAFLTSDILSFPEDLNNNDSPIIEWGAFIKQGMWNMTRDALKNISYRLKEFTNMSFRIMGDSADGPDVDTVNSYRIVLNTNEEDGYLNILDILCAKIDDSGVDTGGGDKRIPFRRLLNFSSFNICPEQYVDYSKLFKCCPNVTNLYCFLKCDLSKAKIDNLLLSCKNLVSIYDSCTHVGYIDNAPTIDLYNFFDWSNNNIKKCTNLFSSDTDHGVGFVLNKTISYFNFKNITENLIDCKNLTKLMNIFSYCTITNYDNADDIILGVGGDDKIMDKITHIDYLFYMCKGLDSRGNILPLRIRRSFFEKLPNVKNLIETFSGVYFADMLSFDFFCKRKYKEESVKIEVGGDYKDVVLKTHFYDNSIDTLNGCFSNAKFMNCRCWFDIEDVINVGLIPEKDKIVYNGSEIEYTEYYKISLGDMVKYEITEPVAKTDTFNNFTNYIKEINIGGIINIHNHNIEDDLKAYKNISDDKSIYPYKENGLGIYPTYCCLPPDIFYGCTNKCDLSRVFANTNIIGVLPQHLLSSCSSGKYENMLLNTNIMPNVFYHRNLMYDDMRMAEYIDMIKDIPIDDSILDIDANGDSDSDAIIDTTHERYVLFRNSNGELRRRYSIDLYPYFKSQYVYVPIGYTNNSNLNKAFTFRYNLPDNVVLGSQELSEKYAINWERIGEDGKTVSGMSGKGYSAECSPENKPAFWPFYNQYFFFADESIDWKYVYNMNSPFILDSDDVDYSRGKSRIFSSTSTGDNKWWGGTEEIKRSEWYNKTKFIFNVFLNLCGERDAITGELKDCGCLISKAMDRNNNPQISNFISGNLCTFLNGKVLDCDGYRLSAINGSNIISFMSFGRNIILPTLNTLPKESVDAKVILSFNRETSQFYRFMFENNTSYNNYVSRYFGNNIPSGFIINDDVKYLVI